MVDSGACRGAFRDAMIEFVRKIILDGWSCRWTISVNRGRKVWTSAMGYNTRVLRRSDQTDGVRLELLIGAEG